MFKMKFLAFLTLLIVSSSAVLAHAAGPSGSGGGKGVVCRDSSHKIQSVELLDLWESRTLYNRGPKVANQNLAIQVQEALTRLQFAIDMGSATIDGVNYSPSQIFIKLANEKAEMFLHKSQNVQYLNGVTLTLTEDSYEMARPENCAIEQIVNYVDSMDHPLVIVNNELFTKMSVSNQAALIAHEAFYAILRSFGEQNSLRVRRAIGYVFAGYDFPDIKTVLGSEFVLCSGPDSELITEQYSAIYFYKNPRGTIKALPSTLWGLPAIGFFETDDKYTNDFGWPTNDFCSSHTSTGFLALPGLGPVDFTRDISLAMQCTLSGESVRYIFRGSFIPHTTTTQELTCRKVNR